MNRKPSAPPGPPKASAALAGRILSALISPLRNWPRRAVLRSAWIMTFTGFVTYVLLPTAAPYILFGCALAPATWYVLEQTERPRFELDAVAAFAFALCVWIAASLLWSKAGAEGVAATLRFIAFGLIALVAANEVGRMPDDAARANAGAIMAAVAVGALLLLIDMTFGMPVRRWLMSVFPLPDIERELITIDRGWITAAPEYLANKSFSVMTSLVWAVLLIALSWSRTRAWKLATVALGACYVLAVALSDHETSKLALLLSALIFSAAYVSPNWGWRLNVVGWTVATLAMIPLVLALSMARLEQSGALQASARHRLMIWTATVDQVRTAPLLGQGIAATRAPPAQAQRKWQAIDGRQVAVSGMVQPHNIYLQIWNELGAIGALLTWALGLAILRRINTAPAPLARWYHAAFATAAVQLGLNWSMNSSWYLASFAVAALTMIFAGGMAERAQLTLRDGRGGDSEPAPAVPGGARSNGTAPAPPP